MKNRINLYTPEMQPKLQILTLPVAFVLWSVGGIMTLLVYLYLNSQNQALQADFSAVAARKSQQSAVVASIKQEIAAREKDQQLIDSIEQKQIVLRLKQRVLSELAGQESLKSSGFSGLMLALASAHEHGIWLTRLNLNGREIIMEGGALESSSVPKWLDNLGATEYFKDREFAATRMYRDQQQQLFFVLGSHLDIGMSADEH